jgi:hypothetical protein
MLTTLYYGITILFILANVLIYFFYPQKKYPSGLSIKILSGFLILQIILQLMLRPAFFPIIGIIAPLCVILVCFIAYRAKAEKR